MRLCPDEWKHDLGIDYYDEAGRVRLEQRLWQLGQELLGFGQSVILENGFWAREERDELPARREISASRSSCTTSRHPSTSCGDAWRSATNERSPALCPIQREDLERWARQLEAPDDAELALFDPSS